MSLRPSLALPALLALLALAACGTSPPLSELEACRAEVRAAIGSDDWQPSRLRRVDECMRARGWRPTPGCLETGVQGSNFCEYRR